MLCNAWMLNCGESFTDVCVCVCVLIVTYGGLAIVNVTCGHVGPV